MKKIFLLCTLIALICCGKWDKSFDDDNQFQIQSQSTIQSRNGDQIQLQSQTSHGRKGTVQTRRRTFVQGGNAGNGFQAQKQVQIQTQNQSQGQVQQRNLRRQENRKGKRIIQRRYFNHGPGPVRINNQYRNKRF